MTPASAPGAVLGFFSHQDLPLERRLQRWRPPRWVRWWMIAATRGGDGWLWWAQGMAMLVEDGRRRWVCLAAAALACALGILTFQALKRAIARPRPSVRERQPWTRLLPPDEFSFPSGHTITAFAFTVSVVHFYPPLLPWLLFCALSAAASRVLLGLHFLSDVLAGCGLGSALGYVACHVMR